MALHENSGTMQLLAFNESVILASPEPQCDDRVGEDDRVFRWPETTNYQPCQPSPANWEPFPTEL